MTTDTPTFETLSVEPVDEHVAIVRLNRPDASNALNTQMGRDLVRYFEDVALDPKGLRCIVLTGTGDKAFCAGGDLKERRGMTDEAWTRQHVIFERMVRALIDCRSRSSAPSTARPMAAVARSPDAAIFSMRPRARVLR